MAPRVDPVCSDEAAPSRAEVVVIGGGIIGASAAFFLARKGISTVLCEKGHIAGEQSSRNWGWCRKSGRDPREIPLIIESMQLWQGMNAMLEADTGFRQSGVLHLCDSQAETAKCEAWLEHTRPYQLDSYMLRDRELDNVAPGSARAWIAAMHTPSDGWAEPRIATPAIANGARRLGAKILTSCAVRGIETAAGRVAAAVTERGRIGCDAVVLAGGAWSRLFCGSLELHLPQLKVMTSVLRTERLKGGPECLVFGPGLAFRKNLEGGYVISQANRNVADITPDSFLLFREFLPVIGARWEKLRLRVGRRSWQEWRTPRRWALDQASPFEATRVLDPEPYEPFVDEAFRNTAKAFPVFQNVPIAETWAGMIDVTPDVVPVISPVELLPGFFIATGFSGHGFGIGPGAGKLIAELVVGDSPSVDPASFRFSRFVNGSRPRPSPLAM